MKAGGEFVTTCAFLEFKNSSTIRCPGEDPLLLVVSFVGV
jgi:hypothetical protein